MLNVPPRLDQQLLVHDKRAERKEGPGAEAPGPERRSNGLLETKSERKAEGARLLVGALVFRRTAAGEDDRDKKELKERHDNLGITPEVLDQTSMEERITPNLPPAFVWFGTDDKLLIPAQKVLDRAISLGCRIDLELAKDADHGFFNDFEPYFSNALRSIDTFLESIGFVEGPPTI